ncbi:MAG: signal peptidase II [Gammaproteobacteria bacterium]
MIGKVAISGTALRWLWVSALIVGVDQLTKWIIERQFELFEILRVGPYLDLTRLHNEGAAFSLLAQAGGWQRWFFVGLAAAISVLILGWLRTLPARGHPWLSFGLVAILGGAVANGIDRIQHGYVVDFLHFHWGGAYFPAFNAADIAITTGAIMVIIDAIWHTQRVKGRDT